MPGVEEFSTSCGDCRGNLLGHSGFKGDSDKVNACAFLPRFFEFFQRVSSVIAFSVAEENDDLAFGALAAFSAECKKSLRSGKTLPDRRVSLVHKGLHVHELQIRKQAFVIECGWRDHV